ncbi:hypothetical protein N9I83_01835 [bacterium]|jgi:hypothetical protein|nr:hypothetical protein [bacterium]|tara:strand:+ start:513 stop:722 length:210 start_codon:yes stop_codon:yes gene_type:complete
MRLNEFYNPNEDKFTQRKETDVRKGKLTLQELNKLRKIRDIRQAEQIEHNEFVRTMYSQPAQEGAGGII